jgi:hypothetical protein
VQCAGDSSVRLDIGSTLGFTTAGRVEKWIIRRISDWELFRAVVSAFRQCPFWAW